MSIDEYFTLAHDHLDSGEFEIYYTNLLTNLKNAQKNIDVDDNPIIALESISKIKEKIKSCDILKVEIYNTRFKKKLLQKFVDNITYYDDFNRKYGIGRLEEWDISVIANPISKEFDIANILSDIDNKNGRISASNIKSSDINDPATDKDQDIDADVLGGE